MYLPTYSLDDYHNPAMRFSNTIQLFGHDYTPGYPEIIILRKQEQEGLFWNTPVRLTWTTGDSFDPA